MRLACLFAACAFAIAPASSPAGDRKSLLASGEAALASSNVAAANLAFERAAAISHAPDTEMGLVRAYMQGGEYRRALAFVAHTAAAHRESPEGTALYIWLLRIGGQKEAARRLLDEAQIQFPSDASLAELRRVMDAPSPRMSPRLLTAPLRLAPYGPDGGLPAAARVAGSGVLVDEGRRVIVPLSTVGRESQVWVRNGLGALARASVEKRASHAGIALLKLDAALPAPAPFQVSPRAPFPGAIAYLVEYAESSAPTPGWPVLSGGFLGAASPDGAQRALGIEVRPGARGGPVFDAGGHLVGVSLRGPQGADRFVTTAALRESVGSRIGPDAPAGAARAPVDLIYEHALLSAVQVIVKASPVF